MDRFEKKFLLTLLTLLTLPTPLPLLSLFLLLVLAASPLQAAEKPPGLIDRLLDALGREKMPRLVVQEKPPAEGPAPAAPPAATAPTAPRASSGPPRPAGPELARNFLPVYDLDRGGPAAEETGKSPPLLPFFAPASIEAAHRGVYALVVMIPDSARDAARAYALARAAQDAASAQKPEWYAANAFVFVPQFLAPEDIAARAAAWPDKGAALLRWAGGGWIYGAGSSVSPAAAAFPAPRGVSSFAALDFALLALARKSIFPDLERVVVAGAGAGGDFVQRYAALGIAPDILASDGLRVRFVVANAWSYLYLDKTRAAPLEAGAFTGAREPVFAEPEADACPQAQLYPYGLEALPPYGRKQGKHAIRLRYDSRAVIYLAGSEANRPLADSAPGACARLLQGRALAGRARLYFAHLRRLYGADAMSRAQRLYMIPGAGAAAAAQIWQSPCGLSALFGDGSCNQKSEIRGQ